jgi:hypothetical protein
MQVHPDIKEGPDTITTKMFPIDQEAYARAMWTRTLGKRLLIVTVALLVYSLVAVGLTGNWTGTYIVWAMTVIAWPIVAVSLFFRVRYAIRHPKNEQNFQPRIMTFNSRGVTIETLNGTSSQVPWVQFIHAERRGGFTLLFLSTITHFIVPDDCFETGADRDGFFALVSQNGKWKGKPPAST